MGASVTKPTIYQAVTVGESKWTHARSLFDLSRTACGLERNGAFVFGRTERPIDCPFCVKAMGVRAAS